MSDDAGAQPCRTCGAPVFWLANDSTGRLAPVDVEPTDRGNCRVDLDAQKYRVLPGVRAIDARAAGERLRLNHWVTCKKPPRPRGSALPALQERRV